MFQWCVSERSQPQKETNSFIQKKKIRADPLLSCRKISRSPSQVPWTCRAKLKQLYSALVSRLHPQFWAFLPFMDISAFRCSSASKHIRVTYNSADLSKCSSSVFTYLICFFRIKTKIVQKVRGSFPFKEITALQLSWSQRIHWTLWTRFYGREGPIGKNVPLNQKSGFMFLIWAFFYVHMSNVLIIFQEIVTITTVLMADVHRLRVLQEKKDMIC